ncbi:MAG: hypothetical protein GY861_19855, partial [bacterium]|nr:hypothetical protein [bacterium]
ALQKQCQEQVNKASKRKEETGKELQCRQKGRIQRVVPEPFSQVSPEIRQTYEDAPNLRVTIPTNGTEERKITHRLSLDTIILDDSEDELEIIGEVKTKESAGSEKVAEIEKEESEGVAEVHNAEKEEETAMDTEATSSVGAPEVVASAPVTPMETSTAPKPQPSAAILDQSSASSLIPSTLERALHLSYPFDSYEDLIDVEKNLRESLPHQVVAKVQSFTKLIQETDLHLIPSDVIAFLDSILSVLEKAGAKRSFINSLIILVTKDVFHQCKVSEPSSVLPFYWRPNFHLAADTSWISRQAEWAKFTKENPDSPWAA